MSITVPDALARVHEAIEHNLSAALAIARECDGSAATIPAPRRILHPLDASKTIVCPPSERQRKRWRQTARRRLVTAVVSVTPRSAPVEDCCLGKWFHTNECPNWREATTRTEVA
jgi:hypothetical protein